MNRSISNPISMEDIVTPTSSSEPGITEPSQQPGEELPASQVNQTSGTAISPLNAAPPGLSSSTPAMRSTAANPSSTDIFTLPEMPEEFLQVRSHLIGAHDPHSAPTQTLRRIEGWSFTDIGDQTLLDVCSEHPHRQILIDHCSENLTNGLHDITLFFSGRRAPIPTGSHAH